VRRKGKQWNLFLPATDYKNSQKAMKSSFNLKLSRKIDMLHVEMEKVKRLPATPLKVRKLLVLRNELRALERKVKV